MTKSLLGLELHFDLMLTLKKVYNDPYFFFEKCQITGNCQQLQVTNNAVSGGISAQRPPKPYDGFLPEYSITRIMCLLHHNVLISPNY